MTTDNVLPTAPSDALEPQIPHPLELELSDEEVREFQRILREESKVEVPVAEAKEHGLELLRLTLMLMDPAGYERRMKVPPVLNRELVTPLPPTPAPVPSHVPLPLEGDHLAAIAVNLERLPRELQFVKRRPSTWRYGLVALWDALAHALAAHRPDDFQSHPGLGELPRLYRAVALERPELPQVEHSIEMIDELRTRWMGRAVTRWPVTLQQIPGVFQDGLRVVRRLEPKYDEKFELVRERLESLVGNKGRRW